MPVAATFIQTTPPVLYGERIKMAVPDDNVILPEIISKSCHFQRCVKAMINGPTSFAGAATPWQAEELGVTSKN